jgi:glycosyltransferase involved in cell wall biosynthesis
VNFAIVGSRGFPSTYGGYETLVRYLAPHLVRGGHDVTVYGREPGGSRGAKVIEGVRCVNTRGLDSKSLSTLTFGLTATLSVAKSDFDAVLVLNVANGFWFPLLKAKGVPFAVNTDGIEWERRKWNAAGRAAFRAGAELTARFGDELVADSRAIADIWQDKFGRESTFIPYGAPIVTQHDPEPLRPLGLDERPFVLVVARLVPENNVGLILDALDSLGPERPAAVIVGGANYESDIGKRLEGLQGTKDLTWLGHVSDQGLLTALWSNCAVYVHGHSVGGTNPALLQALGAGAPTLALDTIFNAEVLPFEQQRFPDDPTVLSARIKEVIESPALQQEMRHRGQEIVRQHYSWNDVCDAYAGLLERIAAE